MKHYKNFGSKWFVRWQVVLLWFLNNWFRPLRYLSRWILRIHNDVNIAEKIHSVAPNHYKVLIEERDDGSITFRSDFRTHWKFAKRIYYAFRPLCDLYFAFRVVPAASDGYVFGHAFFERRQPMLLYLLRFRWFRWCMRIHGKSSDVDTREIIKILPNAIWWREGKELVVEFRTHNKFSKRIYYAFRPLWWIMHAWDWAIADRWVPSLSFGFNNLTVYPDPDPETTSCDGYAFEYQASGVSWATLKGGSGTHSGSSDANVAAMYFEAHTSSNLWTQLSRSMFLFDTSPLTSSAVLSEAVLSLYATYKADLLGITPSADIYTATTASNTSIASGDFDGCGSTSQTGSPIAYSSLASSAYNNFTFDATGIGNVSKTGISKWSLRNPTYDVGASTPTWSSGNWSGLWVDMADQAGTAQDPKLRVKYKLDVSTTVTTYPDGDPETETVDGRVRHALALGSGISWASLRAAAGNEAYDSDTQESGVYITSDNVSNMWRRCVRSIFLFDTSPLSETLYDYKANTISAIMSICAMDPKGTDDLSISPKMNIYTSNPASNTALVPADFTTLGSTALCDTDVTFASWTAGTYSNWTLNSTGLGNIVDNGITKLGAREVTYDVGGSTPTWSSTAGSAFDMEYADQTGVSKDPKLVITYNVSPGNNFLKDTNCKALWRFEPSGLTKDTIGGNTLSVAAGTPASNTTYYKEGSGSVYYNGSSYHNIADASLDSGFPYKSGESNKNISVCAWFRKDTLTGSGAIFAKFLTAAGGRTIQISVLGTSGAVELGIGWSSGNDSSENIATTAGVSAAQWYHVGVTFEDSTKSYRIRVWDDNAQTILEDKNGTSTNNMYISTTEVTIGARSGAGRQWDGYIDEVLVFNDILTASEIDNIRNQRYGVGYKGSRGFSIG